MCLDLVVLSLPPLQVQHARHHFLYYPELSDTELSNDFTATDMLMLKLCQHLNYLSNAG